MHPILFKNGTVYLLKVFGCENKSKHSIIGTVSFFKMLGFNYVPEYSDALVEEIAVLLKQQTCGFRVRHVVSEYVPCAKRRTIRLNLFDIKTQLKYEVLLGEKERPFERTLREAQQA